jgi:TRAP-type C4-dicarboxylate transport system substrate-binding protein
MADRAADRWVAAGKPQTGLGRMPMIFSLSRRTLIAAGAAVLAASVTPSFAQDKPALRFSAVFSEQDIRAKMMKMFADEIADQFTFEGYYGGTLFKQGTELVALQRGNLEMGNIAPQDIANQIPAWSILTSAYLFRDAAHLKTFFASEPGQQMKDMVREQLGVRILGATYFGSRQVGLKPDKKINTPADMAGIKLRMPPGEAWQFLGQSLGANPTAMAYAEVYTGLQTGAIDGQDNPLPNVQNMKFYEVMSQIVLTSHLVGYDLLTVSSKVWDAMTPEGQEKFQAAADKAVDWSTAEHQKQEAELVAFFKERGLEIYEPDVAAFRAHAQKKYLESDLAKSWPEGMVDKINAL